MRWQKKFGNGCGSVAAVFAIAAAALWIWKPWQPPIVVEEPGPLGRRVTDHGLLANYYPGSGSGHRPAILMLGGSEGGIGTAVTREARAVAARGFAVLTISYFRAPGQPLKLEMVPLENFDTALAWLKAQPEVDPVRVALVGGSKGGEAALLVATRHPEIKATVAGMPSSVAWAGVDWNFGATGASWSAGGKPVPYAAYGKFSGGEVASLYRSGLAVLPATSPAFIPIERVSGPVLLVCGEADTLWPSCPMARQVAARAARFGHPVVTVLAYPDAGHAVFGIPNAADAKEYGSAGGSAAGNLAARRDDWPKTLAFIDATLRP